MIIINFVTKDIGGCSIGMIIDHTRQIALVCRA